MQTGWTPEDGKFETSYVADPDANSDSAPGRENSTPRTSTVRVGTSFHIWALIG